MGRTRPRGFEGWSPRAKTMALLDAIRDSTSGETTQAEAIPPDVLSRIVAQAILARRDNDVARVVLVREARDRSQLLVHLEQVLGDEE